MRSLLFCLLSLLCVQMESIAQNRKIDSLKTVLTTSKDDTSKAKAMDNLSDYFQDKHADTGLSYAKGALLLAEKANWKPGMARSYRCIGGSYFALSDTGNALQNYRKAQEIYEQIGDTSGMAYSIYSIGNVYVFQESDYQKPLPYFERAIKLFEQIKEKKGLASSYQKLGIVYGGMGHFTKSLENYQRAESMNEEIGNKSGIASCANSIGELYDDLAEYPKALEYCKKALSQYDSLGSRLGVASSLAYIGNIYLNSSKYDSAISYLQKSEKLYDELGSKLGESKTIDLIGQAYAGLLNYAEAMNYYQKALDLYRGIGFKSGMADLLGKIGYIYMNSPKKYAIAEKTMKESLAVSIEVGNQYAQKYALQQLSFIYAKQKDFQKAYETYKKYVVVNDSIYTDENQKKTTLKEIEYEYSKKEALLKAEQEKKDALAAAEIKRQTLIRNYTIAGVALIGVFSFFMIVAYNKRKKANFEKQVSEVEMQSLRLQMNPHFIFNCMHSINKYVIDNEKQLASEFLIRFSKLMRLVLENSREKAVSIQEDLLALEMYIQLEALRFKNKFGYSINIDPAIDIEKAMIPPMLLQPFVENSIVHGIQNKEGGHIKINIEKEGEMFRCIVEDNGIGRTQSALLRAPVESKRESLGVKITRERLQIINKLKKVKSSIFIVDLNSTDNRAAGLRVELLLPLEVEF